MADVQIFRFRDSQRTKPLFLKGFLGFLNHVSKILLSIYAKFVSVHPYYEGNTVFNTYTNMMYSSHADLMLSTSYKQC